MQQSGTGSIAANARGPEDLEPRGSPVAAPAPGLVSYETAERIRLRKAQYCRFIDTKQWGELAKVMLPDATFAFLGVAGELLHTFASAKELIEQTAPFVEGARTSHRVSNSELYPISETEVVAIWAMEDYLILPAREGKPATSMHGYGHYHERWRLVDGEWALARLELRRTILQLT